MASRKPRRAPSFGPLSTEPRPPSPEAERRTALALAFEHAPIGIALFGLRDDLSMVAVNRALCDMLGYSEQELVNADPRHLTYPDDWRVELDYAQVEKI